MQKEQKLALIDEAINEILANLKNGFEISEWEMDGIKIKKKSPLELISELEKIRDSINKKSLPRSVQYVFWVKGVVFWAIFADYFIWTSVITALGNSLVLTRKTPKRSFFRKIAPKYFRPERTKQ